MKVKSVLTILGVLVICFLLGCGQGDGEKYRVETELAAAQAKVAELQAELGVQKATVTELQGELEACQVKIVELEACQAKIAELEACQAKIAELEACQRKIVLLEAEMEALQALIPTPEASPQSSGPISIQEEVFSYTGFGNTRASVSLAMLDAQWADNTLTVSWELNNACDHKILLDLLLVRARDQMRNWGETEFTDSEAPIAIYPSLQDTQQLWPGETVRFDAEWKFGPLSDVITVTFVSLEGIPEGGGTPQQVSPSFEVTRSAT